MIIQKFYLFLGITFILIGIFLTIMSLGIHKNGKFTFIGLIGPFPIIIVDNKISYITILSIFIFLFIVLLFII
ncbi:MAG: hypothetical protein QXL14_01225, partial [Candidatus Aenigmatarchaeota archaeon]